MQAIFLTKCCKNTISNFFLCVFYLCESAFFNTLDRPAGDDFASLFPDYINNGGVRAGTLAFKWHYFLCLLTLGARAPKGYGT